MITLEDAIILATQAHEGQWRHPTPYNSPLDLDQIQTKHPDDKFEKTFLANVYNRSKPYIIHPLAVMEMMDTEEEKIVAVLHDVIEDTEATLEINFQSITSSIIYKSIIYYIKTETTAKSLYYLTKQKEQSYKDYIYNISQNKLATKVKIADIVCNLADNPSEHAKQKYLKALPVLLKGIK